LVEIAVPRSMRRWHLVRATPRLLCRCVASAAATPIEIPVPTLRPTIAAIPRDAGATYFGTSLPADRGAVLPGHEGQYYQRVLPAAQVPFASEEGRRMFREALLAGTMESYFFLAEQFRTQDEPTFCGLTTLAMVLNSLHIDPMRTWKGAWRWFNEQNLACCTGPERVRAEGLSFDMFRSLAACNGAEVQACRAPNMAEAGEAAAFAAAFREAARSISQSSERQCLVVCYSREFLGQSGAGHFSPVGGYHEGSDSVLVMDVARFKYPPHWVPLEDLAKSMLQIDHDTNKPRGFLQLRLPQRVRAAGGAAPPLRAPFVPPAAGRLLSEGFASKLADLDLEASGCPLPAADNAHVVFMRRFLTTVAAVEPQVFGQLLQVGDVAAVTEVFNRLASYQPFRELCEAYDVATRDYCREVGANFPPLRYIKVARSNGRNGTTHIDGSEDLTPWSCGELWVLLLLLLPEHMQVAVSPDIVYQGLAKGLTRAVRGPWALPLEALRETLSHILPQARQRRCVKKSDPAVDV